MTRFTRLIKRLTCLSPSPPSTTPGQAGLETLEPRRLLSGSLSAEFLSIDNSSQLTGYVTTDLVANTTSTWVQGSIRVKLTKGEIYQDPAGRDVSTVYTALHNNPSVEFDTGAGNPYSYTTMLSDGRFYDGYHQDGYAYSSATPFYKKFGAFYLFDDVDLDFSAITYAPTNDPVNLTCLARITLSDDAEGSWWISYQGDYMDLKLSDNGTIESGRFIVPDPPTSEPPEAEFVWVDNTEALDGYTTADLQITSAEGWTAATFLLELHAGSIYQDPAGGIVAPDPSGFAASPGLAFDTYVVANDSAVTITGGASELFGDGLRFDSSGLGLSWSGPSESGTNTFNLGRITLSDDANGVWSLKLVNAAGESFYYMHNHFENGELAPPPPPPPPASAPPPPPPAVAGDYNGDGKPDLLWQNLQDSNLTIWTLDGSTLQSTTPAVGNGTSQWQLVGTGDFTGNGENDGLWRNTGDGRIYLDETVSDTEINGQALPTVSNPNWQIAGVADFTGDGQSDILWRNRANGRNIVWEMDGENLQQKHRLKTLRNADWRIAGVGDMNGDGGTDILWRNLSNGRNTVWEMDGTTYQGKHALKRTRSQAWQIAAVGDYTGDGKADIVWRNTQSGKNAIWEMDGVNFLSRINLPDQDDPDLQIAGPLLGLWEA